MSNTSGNDQFDGLSSEYAFKTLNKINYIIYNPGDKILFKTYKLMSNT